MRHATKTCLLVFLPLALVVVSLAGPRAVFAQRGADADKRKAFFEAKRAFERAVKAKDLDGAIAGLKGIGELESKVAVEFLISLERTPSADLYQTLCDVLAGLSSPNAQEAMRVAYKQAAGSRGRNWQRQVLLIDAFGQQDGKPGIEALGLAVKDAHPKVRLAAIRALADSPRPDKARVELLIESLRTSERALDTGTPHVEARKALAKFVGIDQPSYAGWKKYWNEHAAKFQPREKSEEQSAIAIEDKFRYFGITITSRRALFIIDISESMRSWDHEGWQDKPNAPITSRPEQGGGGADKFGRTLTSKPWIEWLDKNPEAVRMSRAKGELSRMIESLPPGTAFNILAFNSKLHRWQPGLTPVSKKSRKHALQFVKSLTPGGATAADLALAELFKRNEAADTVYILSDGRPSRDGRSYMKVEPLLRQVAMANRFRRIIIHALGLGSSAQKFLQPLAEENQGKYIQVVGPPQIDQKKVIPRKANR